MKTSSRLRIALQKSGRLNNDSLELLAKCGLKIRVNQYALYCHGENLPIDILFVRDDDIPTLVMDGVCDLGIIGENVLLEQTINYQEKNLKKEFAIVKNLGFSRCLLAIALPKDKPFTYSSSLQNCRIATSYPNLLRDYLLRNNVTVKIMTISIYKITCPFFPGHTTMNSSSGDVNPCQNGLLMNSSSENDMRCVTSSLCYGKTQNIPVYMRVPALFVNML